MSTNDLRKKYTVLVGGFNTARKLLNGENVISMEWSSSQLLVQP